jgi:ABC-2 type transport system permease protein
METESTPAPPGYEISAPTPAPAGQPAVIADLSYRGYDGPLEPPMYRWWAIARMVMRLTIKKKGFWVWSIMSAWYFIILIGAFYLAETLTAGFGMAGGTAGFFKAVVWKDQFLTAFSYAQIFYFVLALLVGVGAIANDNRANALLVYLSKPCSKLDYLIGKWFGIAALIFAVAAIPNVLFYLYCLLSYRQYGFWDQDHFMLPKLILMATLPAVLHASLSLAVSSLFKQGRLAGATYGALYFILYFLTTAFNVVRAVALASEQQGQKILDTLIYLSIDGVQIGLAKVLLGTPGGPIVKAGVRQAAFMPPIPNGLLFTGMLVVACAAGLGLAWSRIRAVEVIGG